MHAYGSVGLGAGFGGEIEELDGGVVFAPFVAYEGLHDFSVSRGRLAGAGDLLAGAEFLFDAAADLGHEIVILGDVPVGALVLQLDFDQLAVAEIEDRSPKALLDEAFDGPGLAAADVVAIHDVGFGPLEKLFHAVGGFAPLEAEGGIDLLSDFGIGRELRERGRRCRRDEQSDQEQA